MRVVDFLASHPKVTKVNHPALESHPDHALYKKYFPKGAGSIFTEHIDDILDDLREALGD